MRRVLFAGGGTGGHLYPGLALAERLRSQGSECMFVGTTRGVEHRVVPERGFRLKTILARGLSRRPLAALKALLETGLGTVQSWLLLGAFRPQLVVGTGGYVCAPVVVAAALRGVPCVLLEQNAIPGKTVRWLSRLARRICVSFEESLRYLPAERAVVTGNPVREAILTTDRQAAREALGIPEGRALVLVTGASQGARSLNEAVIAALPRWQEQDWTVLHLTGPAHLETVQQATSGAIPGARLEYRCQGYLGEMAQAYAAADLVVCRSGATTLAEVTARGLASVLVPYPHAAEGHQEKNALALVKVGAAVMLDDARVVEDLADTVTGLLADPGRLAAMAAASRGLGRPEALDRILTICRSVVGPQEGPRRVTTVAGSSGL